MGCKYIFLISLLSIHFVFQIHILSSLWEDVILFPFQDGMLNCHFFLLIYFVCIASLPLSAFQEDECTESLRMLMGLVFNSTSFSVYLLM